MATLRRNPNAELEKLLYAAEQARRPFDREGWLNVAFYLNEQYVEWNADSDAIRRIPRTEQQRDTPRPVVNKIMHYAQQMRAQVLKNRPTPEILPATDDLMDMSDAQVTSAYCDWLTDPTVAAFDQQLSRAAMWAVLTPGGYLKWVWNPRLKRPDIVPCSFFEVYPDPYAKMFGKCRYVIHSQFMDVEQVYEQWGKELPAHKTETADAARTELLRGMGSAPVLNGVTVNELWAVPSRRHPKGRYACWSGTEILTPEQDHPYDHKRLPFTQIGALERPDSLHYMSPVSYLRSAQMELNQYHAQRIQGRKNWANHKWWIPTELELEQDPDDSPGQILRGTSTMGQEPKIIQGQAPGDNGDGAWIEQQMMNIVGLHEVSQAQVPGRVEAAKAIEMLRESDDERTATMTDTIKAAISEGFYQIIRLAQQYEKSSRLVAVYSREGLPEVKHFKGSMVDPGMRVRASMGTGLARSKAARQEQLMTMWQNKIITDPELMAELMDVPIPSFANARAYDQRLARNENLVMAKGEAVVPNSWDDHMIHTREHNDYRKTTEYLKLGKEGKQVFEFHVQQHEGLMIQQLAKQAKMQQLAAAATQPPGGGPPPQ
jgi:hypothetical protein